MNYEIIEFEDVISGVVYKSVQITREDGSIESFPVDETNPRYQQYLIDTDGGLPLPEEQA